MESKVRGEEEERQKVERLVEKLKNHINNRSSTPAHISFVPNSIVVSSRKLAAAFWEFHQYHYQEDCSYLSSASARMHRGANGFAGASNRRQRHGKAVAVKENGLDLSQFLRDPSPDHQPDSAGSLRRQIGQMLIKHHQSIERNNHALQPVSPASYGSSLEVTTYNKAVTPSSSLDFRGRASREPHYNLKTSTELLKVLNRIWSLEEQHVSNISLIKALKTEVAHSRVRIKELLRYQQADRHELDGVVKQLAEEKLLRKNKEVERMSSAVQSVRKELEDERKLRKRSESLHRKLARELSEVKSSLSNCVKELERGAKSNKMMELLCDEFAKGIKSYEEEIHGLKKKNLDKDWEGRGGGDQLVLHIAESWLDERMQMRLEGGDTLNGNNRSVLDKLEVEIETFLQEKRNEIPRNRRNSLESVPFNALSAPPRDVDCEEDSGGSDSNCFELKKAAESHGDETKKPNQLNKDSLIDEKAKSPSSFQVNFEDQMAWAISSNGKKKTARAIEDEEEEDVKPENSNNIKKPEDECATTNKNDVMGEMIRTHRRLLSETREIDEASCNFPSSRRQASPVRQWISRTVAPGLLGSSDIAIAHGVKDNTLKTKLAKSSKSRLRLFKG
ncbi:unnamed protein product [Arabidopsis lyrata]|uniref:Intracellular protein transporter USO1-like protein n=2 Tax=Arabidopsis lyrata subsp. lyrata TaxID=81972 RepID=D7MIT3_ARALL|nr:uncharacterized protein At5g41620 isoform X1 [Arabidopsis lyrata subsp. lyrata]EFH46887.1 hypothetical protein ARALYDRAFT_493825 [Arabidopsis lyrata subsp. lyrata]CAH8277809.1 unnamed protein product [Arabidopsis lyrata]|eukprot:XP_020875404.1 uncharacterized protein At5g41620 isoform X1 [Arabidopsis lyrata subsp. lyrata]